MVWDDGLSCGLSESHSKYATNFYLWCISMLFSIIIWSSVGKSSNSHAGDAVSTPGGCLTQGPHLCMNERGRDCQL